MRVCNRITYIHATAPIGKGVDKAAFHASHAMDGVAAKQSSAQLREIWKLKKSKI